MDAGFPPFWPSVSYDAASQDVWEPDGVGGAAADLDFPIDGVIKAFAQSAHLILRRHGAKPVTATVLATVLLQTCVTDPLAAEQTRSSPCSVWFAGPTLEELMLP